MFNSILNRVNLNTMIASIIFLLFFGFVSADIKSIKLYNDQRHRIHVKDFCFSETGHVSISLKSLTTTGGAPVKNSSQFGFLIWAYTELYTIETMEYCFLDTPSMVLYLSNPNQTIPITGLDRKYNIFFENCESPGTPVNLEVELETYNLDKDGKKDYLQEYETHLPNVLFVFFVTYVVLIILWIYQCYRNNLFLRKIHVLMTMLIVVKCVALFIAAEEKRYIKVTGRPHGWKIWLYVFHVIRTVLFWTVMMLIGTGWSYMRPLLQARDKIMLGIGVAIQVILNIFYVFLDEMERFRKDYMYWFFALMVLDLASFVVALVPFQWFLDHLREVAYEDGKAARTLQRMRLVNDVLLVVICYGIGTRLWPWLVLGDNFSCSTETSIATFTEIINVLVYGIVFCLLRPMERNEYVAVEEEGEEIALQAIEREFP